MAVVVAVGMAVVAALMIGIGAAVDVGVHHHHHSTGMGNSANTTTNGGVTYDGRSLIINGHHRILFSGSIHYPRSTPEDHMQKFVAKIVSMMKSENLYASQGGPIILSQIENEYQTIESDFGDKGPSYVRWAASMAVQLQTGVPWLMCKQDDAPDPVVHRPQKTLN